jgi:hypothetical protein
MTERIIIRKTNRFTLVGFEILALSVFLSYWLCKKFEWDWITGVVIVLIGSGITGALFFRVRIFRYIFSVLFSLLWGFLIYMFADSLTTSHVSPWLAFGVMVVISLALHKDYFSFERNAVPIEFE